MKLKEFGPGVEAHPKFHYVDPPLDWSANSFTKFISRKITSRKHLIKSNASWVIVYEDATRFFCLMKIELESTCTSLKSNGLTQRVWKYFSTSTLFA